MVETTDDKSDTAVKDTSGINEDENNQVSLIFEGFSFSGCACHC